MNNANNNVRVLPSLTKVPSTRCAFERLLTTAGDLRNENGEESEQSWVRCSPTKMERTAMIERTCMCRITAGDF